MQKSRQMVDGDAGSDMRLTLVITEAECLHNGCLQPTEPEKPIMCLSPRSQRPQCQGGQWCSSQSKMRVTKTQEVAGASGRGQGLRYWRRMSSSSSRREHTSSRGRGGRELPLLLFCSDQGSTQTVLPTFREASLLCPLPIFSGNTVPEIHRVQIYQSSG